MLFDPGDPVDTMLHAESAGQRRTARNKVLIASGRHPLTGRPLAKNGHTCGDCAHHVTHRHAKTYHKCDLRATSSESTDIRVSWPACELWAAP